MDGHSLLEFLILNKHRNNLARLFFFLRLLPRKVISKNEPHKTLRMGCQRMRVHSGVHWEGTGEGRGFPGSEVRSTVRDEWEWQ